MILLDTNVVSETMKPAPSQMVQRWLDEQAAETLYLSSVTIAEAMFGIRTMPDGKRKGRLWTASNPVTRDHDHTPALTVALDRDIGAWTGRHQVTQAIEVLEPFSIHGDDAITDPQASRGRRAAR